MTKMTTIAEAERNLDNLKAKHAEAEGRLTSFVRERNRIEFIANTEGGEARERLIVVMDDCRALADEVDSFSRSIVEAGERLEAAKHQAATAEDRRRAGEALKLLDAAIEASTTIDDAAIAFVRASQSFYDAMHQIDRLGFGPNPELIRHNLNRALESVLVGSPMQIRPMAVGQKRTVTSLTEGWAHQIRNRTAVVLGDAVPDDAKLVRVAS
jgi:hypothetical protein